MQASAHKFPVFLGNSKINHLTIKNTPQIVQLSGTNYYAELKKI